MRNLLRFFTRNYFFLLFLLLEIVCFILIFKYNNYQKVHFLNSSNRLFAEVYNTSNSVSSYFKLNQVNIELAEQVAELENQLQKKQATSIIYITDSIGADSTSVVYQSDSLVMSDDSIPFLYTSARVINNSVNKQHNYITLNKGSKDGIEPDMGIVGYGGVVGIITNVSEHYSTGPTILNTKWKVSAKIKKNNYFGSLSWEGTNPLFANLDEIPYHVELSVGDTIVTSGYSAIFPEGISIGYIESFDRESGDNFYEIKVRLSTSFQTLEHVEVISNVKSEEITSIEEINNNE